MTTYINTETLEYPLYLQDIKLAFPNTSFPSVDFDPPEPFCIVESTEKPEFDSITQYIEEGAPELINGVWTQVWTVINRDIETTEDAITTVEMAEKRRRSAYYTESDPIFFKWQRGEATEQEWLDKIAEIKLRYPDPA